MQYAARFTPQGAIDLVVQSAPQAFPGTLVAAPGTYAYNGTAYVCAAEGLYRFLNPSVDTTNRIIYQSDVYALMSGLSWLCVHGTSDEALTLDQMQTRARTSKLRLRCGPTVDFCRSVLTPLGIQSRVVRWITMGTPTNFDDGHITLEVKIGGVWKNFDPNNGAYYQLADGSHLSAKDTLAPVAAGTFVIAPLDCDASYEVQPFASGQFDVAGWKEIVMIRPDGLRLWLQRIFGAVGIDQTDGLTYWKLPAGSEGRASWVTGLSASYRVVSPATWDGMFYS